MKSPLLIEDPDDWAAYCQGLATRGRSTGFVPTMGALHYGHATLIQRAAAENDAALLSIFVNPTQFNDSSDLEKYPRTLEKDLELARSLGVEAVFLPNRETMYPDDYRYRVDETELSKILCGAGRPGHFTGVLTVVLKLLLLTAANRAYFGEKDYQQYLLVDGMAKAFFLRTKIVPCQLVREQGGLALSSRNERLSPSGRKQAAMLYNIISTESGSEAASAKLRAAGFDVEYVTDIEDLSGGPRRFAAVFLEGVRLIDNVPVPEAARGLS